jgi:hypothetical protein
MRSWDAFEPVALKPAGAITAAFIQADARDYQAAARYINRLPYGRNSSRTDPLIVLNEARGTCSTKHALLRRLATEQELEIALVIGIYAMNGRNTPGAGAVLEKHRLASIPEAHCYLRDRGIRIDVTRAIEGAPAEAIARFIHEEDIAPESIGDYKIALHRRFMQQWIDANDAIRGRSLDDLWRIREECIAALGQ